MTTLRRNRSKGPRYRLTVRLPLELATELQEQATGRGLALNAHLIDLLARELGHELADDPRQRAAS